jgi:hypothetical protein
MRRIVNAIALCALVLAVAAPATVSAVDISSLTTQQIINALGGDTGSQVVGAVHRDDGAPVAEGFTSRSPSSTVGTADGTNSEWDVVCGGLCGYFDGNSGDAQNPPAAFGINDSPFTATIVGRINALGDTDPGQTLSMVLQPEPANAYSVVFAQDLSAVASRVTPPATPFTVDITVDHAYQFVREAGAGTAVDLYVDGALAISDLGNCACIGFDHFEGFMPVMSTTSGLNSNSADSSWRLYHLRTGVVVLPEPASLALLTLGGLTMLRRRR